MKYICVYCFRVDNDIKDFGVLPTLFDNHDAAVNTAIESLKSTAQIGDYEVNEEDLKAFKNVAGVHYSIEYAIDTIY